MTFSYLGGFLDPVRKDELGAETRENKAKGLSSDSLRKEWNARISDEERETLASVWRSSPRCAAIS